MNQQAIIFSGSRRYRILRHFLFWFTWTLCYNLLFHFPVHVFKGWDTSGPGTRNLQELGLPLFFIKTLLVNSFLGTIVPQLLFVYFLLYWFMPRYFFGRKKIITAVLVLLAVMPVYLLIAAGFKYSPSLYNYITTSQLRTGPFSFLLRVTIIDQVTTLPFVTGLALLLKLLKRWWLQQKETAALKQGKIMAELDLLKAQVHPHFLFNTLNNIYSLALTGSPQAPAMIRNLSGMMAYLQEVSKLPAVPLQKEMQLIRDYLDLEKIRYGDGLKLSVEMPGEEINPVIAPMLLIPFVENSFKHGVSRMISQPWISLSIRAEKDQLCFLLRNGRPPDTELTAVKGNIGLKNVKKRLELLYPDRHELKIEAGPDSYSVLLLLHTGPPVHPGISVNQTQQAYALA